MKTQFQARLLQHLLKKKENEGFTLIELLVVVVIIGILAAVALPSMLNQANVARGASAQNTVGSVNRAQQVYRLQNPTFAATYDLLKIGDTVKPDGYDTIDISGTPDETEAKVEATGLTADVQTYCGTATAGVGGAANTSVDITATTC